MSRYSLLLTQVSRGFIMKHRLMMSTRIDLPLWTMQPKIASSPSSDSPTLVLFGYAGSSRSQLEKYGGLYSELGYRSISSILPHRYIFSYDIPAIRNCAEQVLDEIDASSSSSIVCHCFSNNGVAMYQQLFTLLQEQGRSKDFIKGLIIDSAPGPMGTLDNALKTTFFNNQSFLFLPLAMLGVNAANRMPLSENLGMVKLQLGRLLHNYKYKSTPWTGRFMSYHERGHWPALFFYSKEDQLMPWKYVKKVIAMQQSTNRRVEWQLFEKSGHVAHYKNHPDLYTKLVKEFMQSL